MSGLKQKIKNGEAVFGTFISLGSAVSTEIIGTAPWDWVMIDLEHGIGSESDVLGQLQALANTNIEVIIRVEGHNRQRIHRVLDMGAHGIMCPHVDSAAEAALATKAMRYAPEGLRGVAKMVRATNFGTDFDSYHANQAKNLISVIQIETAEAVERIEEIAQVPDIDVLFIGPADLSMSLGVFGQLEHPTYLEAEEKIIKTAQKAGIAVGFLMMNPEDYEKYYNKGVRFFASGTDAYFLKKTNLETAERLVNLRNTTK
ncbi:HpcH/HpaI aldolase family protein [Maribacter sp. 2210JD10-5]|uniref:HpcH/HpaI aldolase family protein n=1 Tax=Maribacter sp. 2210JD10-5 TaxID=3386272 RepID=UPI0039BD4B5E